ncbi:MAG: hypothetical protein DMG57_15700 [Acidobacteria bacterium]|nr:MAG: hypothetical protein DMG57_15700 [Acidobacteriota bacterium]
MLSHTPQAGPHSDSQRQPADQAPLLIAATLLVRALEHAQSIEPGFAMDHRLAARRRRSRRPAP